MASFWINLLGFIILALFAGQSVCQQMPCSVLVLSGGGSYGAFQASVIEQISDTYFDVVTGISAGSLNAFYLSLFPHTEQVDASTNLVELWKSIKTADVYTKYPTRYSLLDNTPFGNTLKKTVGTKLPVRDVIVGTTSLNTGKPVHFDRAKLIVTNPIDVLMASTAIPIVFPPVFMNNDVYVDGGTATDELILGALKYCPANTNYINYHIILCNQMLEETVVDHTFRAIASRILSIAEEEYFNHQVKSVESCVITFLLFES